MNSNVKEFDKNTKLNSMSIPGLVILNSKQRSQLNFADSLDGKPSKHRQQNKLCLKFVSCLSQYLVLFIQNISLSLITQKIQLKYTNPLIKSSTQRKQCQIRVFLHNQKYCLICGCQR